MVRGIVKDASGNVKYKFDVPDGITEFGQTVIFAPDLKDGDTVEYRDDINSIPAYYWQVTPKTDIEKLIEYAKGQGWI